MPELPDIVAYISALEPRLAGATLIGMRIANPFLLRTVTAPPCGFSGCDGDGHRAGRQAHCHWFDGDRTILTHLMIAGRFQWKDQPVAAIPRGKQGLAAFDFSTGTLTLTEAGSKRRASLHLLHGSDALAEHSPGGLDVLETDLAAFGDRLMMRNHTLKRALTDPHLFSGSSMPRPKPIIARAAKPAASFWPTVLFPPS